MTAARLNKREEFENVNSVGGILKSEAHAPPPKSRDFCNFLYNHRISL